MSENQHMSDRCPECNRPLRSDVVRTALWQGERLVVVEGVPASVCNFCMEQYYDDGVSDRLRELAEGTFACDTPVREILVPVFSFNKRHTG